MQNKKFDKPDIDGLLGQISERRESGALAKAPIQKVQPIEESALPTKSKAGKTPKLQNSKTQEIASRKGIGGRPTMKKNPADYVKISPRILRDLKKRADLAILEERFKGTEGLPIKTLDELVGLALEKLISKR